ncbi:1-(5-phosphoribosyl)-5-[(5-phosphoribosylamino)methylideneamino]imidazole-4-carboxamide isomerase [Legionella shakespearei]|uniref:1-(5-phosphoribosyl)-5-[(5-phosphoribosylamino)methylideneamino] imidazole-4-carboxamide isomerase n=1 Tax=Legionella shakespearei DSM 23087 TaxID=1122169 RepID=A0A0W0YSR8_9GAMM|nr:1-(5-phosphoribosyl)-5-[(5-phosphoribosylamino)methylideneamino]imidazole-4-carboxamide isomerase [Legionella shakespearei]KTD59898.1 phosphoribosylformimino-5-aminoimidazole carboxamide ribotide isomerase [Legionella shakespearei DSM 23087]
MLIIPAIDLQAGSCVRLKQGEFDRVTRFDMDPVERAAFFARTGAQRLHIVDLDGAKLGSMQQLPLIRSMQDTGISVQAGGGIRTLEQAILCRDSGIKRLVIGSIAISNPELTAAIIEEIKPENIVLALDVRVEQNVPIPAIHGWQSSSNRTLWEVVSAYRQSGIREILCTDIACDGMMQGPNFSLYQEAVKRFPDINWQASGGIRSIEDIATLKASGVAGAILGLSLYKGTIDLAECLEKYSLEGDLC